MVRAREAATPNAQPQQPPRATSHRQQTPTTVSNKSQPTSNHHRHEQQVTGNKQPPPRTTRHRQQTTTAMNNHNQPQVAVNSEPQTREQTEPHTRTTAQLCTALPAPGETRPRIGRGGCTTVELILTALLVWQLKAVAGVVACSLPADCCFLCYPLLLLFVVLLVLVLMLVGGVVDWGTRRCDRGASPGVGSSRRRSLYGTGREQLL